MRQVMVTIISVLLFSVLCSAQNILKHPITGAEFEVAPKDFTLEMNYKEANNACKKLKDDWRLPTIEELETIYLNKNELGDFKDAYWAEDENYLSFKDGKGSKDVNLSSKKYVRAVRSIKEEEKKIRKKRNMI